MRRLVFDIDGVICTDTNGEYGRAFPDQTRIDIINNLYNENCIILFTARGSTTGLDWRELTESQLEEWGVKYHELIFGKPEADMYIDDKGVNVNDVWRVFA